jgi:hypothetical protein
MAGISQGVVWAESKQHPWVLHEMNKPHDGQRHEPNRHYWSEQEANSATAAALYGEKANQNDGRDRHHIRRHHRGHDAKALDCAQHGYGGRDHGVAEE